MVLALAGCSLQQDVQSNAGDGCGTRDHPAAPALSGVTLQGARFDLSAQRGHVVVLDFWASWCGPCEAQQPGLTQVAQRYGPRGVVVVGVDVRDDDASGRAWAQQRGVPYPSLPDPSSELAARFGVDAPPTTIVVDASGAIASRCAGGSSQQDLSSLLDRLTGSTKQG